MSKHFTHYISLIFVLAAGAFAFTEFSYDRSFQLYIAVATGFAYFTWGVVHHYLHKDLYFSVVIEYLSVALLGIAAIASLLVRA